MDSSQVRAACPCGQPRDGHLHWEGYWRHRANQLLADRLTERLLPADRLPGVSVDAGPTLPAWT